MWGNGEGLQMWYIKGIHNEGARRELFESRGKVLVEGNGFGEIGLGMGDGRKGIQVNGRVKMF